MTPAEILLDDVCHTLWQEQRFLIRAVPRKSDRQGSKKQVMQQRRQQCVLQLNERLNERLTQGTNEMYATVQLASCQYCSMTALEAGRSTTGVLRVMEQVQLAACSNVDDPAENDSREGEEGSCTKT